jgi:hypothetical protein
MERLTGYRVVDFIELVRRSWSRAKITRRARRACDCSNPTRIEVTFDITL